MKSAKHSSWKPASDLKHKDLFFSSDMTKGNHNPIHRYSFIQSFSDRLNPGPVSSMISVRDENGLDPTLDSIRQICRHYEQKCAGKYDKQSTAGREVQAILEELEVRFHFQKNHLNEVVTEWDKYYGPQTPESLSNKYKTIPITPQVLKQYISELEERNKLLEQERLNRLEEEKEEVMEIENAIDIHNRVARDQYHTEMKRINIQKQQEIDDLNNKYNKEIKELKEKYEEEIENMKEKHKNEIESYRIQSEKAENELKKEIDRVNKVIIKQQDEIEEKEEEINSLHSTIEEYTKKLENLTKELVTIQNEITLVAKNKDEEYKKIIDEIQQQFNEREKELLKQIENINNENDLLKYNLNQLQDILNQLQCQYQENRKQEKSLVDISGTDIEVELPKIMVSKELRHKIDTQNPPYKKKWNKNCLNLRYSPQKLTNNIKVFYN